MTLCTVVGVATDRDPFELFSIARDLIGCDESHNYSHRDSSVDAGVGSWRNQEGQGLPGHLATYYQKGWVEVYIDTAYGYRNDKGAGASDLHAWFILEFSKHLGTDAWFWYNEFEQTWHKGDSLWEDRVDNLSLFGNPELGMLA